MTSSRVIPLSKRPGDWAILGFFAVNLLVITYMVDLEQAASDTAPLPAGTPEAGRLVSE